MKTVIKSIVSVVLLISMVFSTSGCAKKIKPVEMNDFKNALEEVFDIDEDDYGEHRWPSYTEIVYYGSGCQVFMSQYHNEHDALNQFEILYKNFMNKVEDKKFKGKKTCVFNEDDGYGYILFDGESDSEHFWPSDMYGHIYGGIYWTVDRTILVIGFEGTNEQHEDYTKNINAMIRALGYPKP